MQYSAESTVDLESVVTDLSLPDWRPPVSISHEWVMDQLRVRLEGKNYVVFSHGTFVLWQEPGLISHQRCIERLRDVAAGKPDFRVRVAVTGDYLVTFRGGVGGILSKHLLLEDYAQLHVETTRMATLPDERFSVEGESPHDEELLTAGLIVRSFLAWDAREPEIIGTSD